jgi:pyridoxine 5-phosphate synthase
MKRLRLGVNVDHVATLRNARGGVHPDPVKAAELALAAGAHGGVAHLREDRRHIRDDVLRRLRALVAPLNMEMAPTKEMIAIARALRPHACCLVPERRMELTTEGGLDVAGQETLIQTAVAQLADAGIRVSLFIDPEPRQVQAAHRTGAPAIELHTGAYASGGAEELARIQQAAALAAALGLECHAGHGLTYENVGPIAAIAEIEELNIGHFLIAQAVYDGLSAAVRTMLARMEEARRGADAG